MDGSDLDEAKGAIGAVIASTVMCVIGVVLLCVSAPVLGIVALFTPIGALPVLGVGELVKRRARRKRLEREREEP